jgi:hypothetical protein
VIELSVWARDRQPGAGQLSKTASRSIQIVDEATYNRMVLRRLKPEALQAKYREPLQRLQALQAAMKELRDHLQERSQDEVAKQLAALADQARKLASDIRAMRRDKCIALLQAAARTTLIQPCGLMRRGLKQRGVEHGHWVVRSARRWLPHHAAVSVGRQASWPSTREVAA